MLLHPSLETLINLLSDEKKEYTKENLNKWCNSLPKEERDFFKSKIKEEISRDEFIRILSDMKTPGIKAPGTPQPTPNKNIPSFYKKGDVLMHPIFQHPYILLEKKEDSISNLSLAISFIKKFCSANLRSYMLLIVLFSTYCDISSLTFLKISCIFISFLKLIFIDFILYCYFHNHK